MAADGYRYYECLAFQGLGTPGVAVRQTVVTAKTREEARARLVALWPGWQILKVQPLKQIRLRKRAG